jgi:hypothetical protein
MHGNGVLAFIHDTYIWELTCLELVRSIHNLSRILEHSIMASRLQDSSYESPHPALSATLYTKLIFF